MSDLLHELVSSLKSLAIKLNRTPTRAEFSNEFRGAHYKIPIIGGYTVLLQAAGLPTYDDRRGRKELLKEEKTLEKNLRTYKSICSKREKIQGFFRSTLDLSEMFARAGNPEVLKISAQPDTHAKFVDKAAWACYLEFLRYWQPHGHIIMGDFADCEGLSHWPDESLEPRRIVPEMKLARAMLQEIVDATPSCTTRIFLEGNHENWIMQALNKMPELFDGLAELDIEINISSLLSLKKFGYDLFPLNEIVQIGDAHFTHGIYCGDNHAKKHLSVFKKNIYYGHLHDDQTYNQTSMDGNVEAATFGCLCRLDAKFLKGRPNNWVHGSAAFEFFPDGSFNWYKLRINNGRMAFNGRVFGAKQVS